jgi:hypothetical protein
MLYALNEPGRFPKGVAPLYEKSLLEGGSYYLVTESGARLSPLADFPITHEPIGLCCASVLVHPRQHGQGLGTMLLLSRLAFLKASISPYHLFIFEVEESFGFYR